MSKLIQVFMLALALAATVTAQTAGRAGRARKGRAATNRPAAKPTPTPAPTQATKPARPTDAPASAGRLPPLSATNNACGCESGPLPAVVAVVGNVRITPADFSPQTQQQVARVQSEVTRARRNELNLQINSLLLEAEAKKRGVTTSKLLEDEVIAKSVNPTDADAQAYFEQKRAEVEAQAGRPVAFEEVKANIATFLREERQRARAAQFAESLRAANAVKVNVAEATPPATPAERARVFATVNGRNITSGDIEDALRPLVHTVQEQVYALRKRDLDTRVNDLLLEREAQKRGVTSRALLEAEVNAKAPVVTEAQAQAFYNENKERLNSEFAQIKYQIIDFLQEQEKEKLGAAFAERLRKAAAVETFLAAPESPAYDISTDDQPSKGNPSAAVTFIEFTDFECPSCAQAHPAIERLMAEYGDRVRFVVRDFPLARHPNALKAAEAAEAAREQGKYWEYAAVLFRNQSSLGVDKLKQYASALGLDRARFDAALDSGKFSESIRRDLLDGQKVGVGGTPALFINGRRINDYTYEGLKAAIEAALKAPARK